MSQAKAITRYVRISPRKARLAADLIRGLAVEEATYQLQFCKMKAGPLLKKTLDSAVANAETQLDVKRENLTVSEVRVDEGSRLKRARSRSKGSQHPFIRRTSHFTVIVSAE
jgi:large subunit ribosomal protein L22